jgi:hypothetical protein
MNKVLLVVALTLGGLIGYVDSRPNWDDTGVTVAAILVCCGLLGAAGPSRPWLWALAVGFWIPLLGITRSGNYGSLLALPFAFAGAYAGMALRRALMPQQRPNPA